MKILITYCSNFNGVLIEQDGVDITDTIGDAAANEMIEHAYQYCDQDGQLTEDFDMLQSELITIAQKHFDGNSLIEVEEDSSST